MDNFKTYEEIKTKNNQIKMAKQPIKKTTKKHITKKEKINKLVNLEEIEEVKPIDPFEGMTNKHKLMVKYFKGRTIDNISMTVEQQRMLWECYYSEFGETYDRNCRGSAIHSYKKLLILMQNTYGDLLKR